MASHAPQQSRGGRAAPSDRQPPVGSSRPHPWELVLHPIKALHFIVGPLVDLPADVALDWFMLAIAAYGLLGIFPERIVHEHHARLFHPHRA